MNRRLQEQLFFMQAASKYKVLRHELRIKEVWCDDWIINLKNFILKTD